MNLVRIYVNGVQVDARQPEDGPGFKPGPLSFKVPLAKGRNVIRAVAVNETGETSAELAADTQSEGALDKRGTLRILAIGVDKYPGLGMACRELDGITPKKLRPRRRSFRRRRFRERDGRPAWAAPSEHRQHRAGQWRRKR